MVAGFALVGAIANAQADKADQATPVRDKCEVQGSTFACGIYANVQRQIPSVDEEAVVLPVASRHVRPRRSADWLAGYWVTSKSECYGGDFGLQYTTDGRFEDYWFSGRYEFHGNRVDHRVEQLTHNSEPGDRVGQKFSRQLKLVGPNEILLTADRREERFYRCPEGGLRL